MEAGARRAKITLISGVDRQLFQMIRNGYSLRKLGRNSKVAHHRAKQIENLTLVGVCSIHVGIFDLVHVEVIWGHSVHFSRNWAVTQKRLIVVRSGRKFGPQTCL